MSDDHLNDAPLMLSISGARGIVGASMTPEVAHRLAAIWGAYLASTATETPRVILGRDSRPSGPALSEAAARGLSDAGCEVIRLGIVTTPTVGVMIGAARAVGGVMITASHNPSPWNGLKLLDGQGTAPSVDVAQGIIDEFQSPSSVPHTDAELGIHDESRAEDTHLAKVLGQVEPQLIQGCGFRVVLDSVNGAGGPIGLNLLERLGCDVVRLNYEPTGDFAHPPEPRIENLGELCQAVPKAMAQVGFAQDPDADRLAIVDETGRYIGEEYTLVLAAMSWLRRYPGVPVVTNLSTSRMIDDVATGFGSTVFRSPVGEANVAEVMRLQGSTIGGEGNGGVMIPAVTWVRDSLTAMALVLELLAREQGALSVIVDDLPTYSMIKQTIELEGDDARTRLLQGIEDLKLHYEGQPGARIQTSDGVRVDLASGWLHLRPSNTEPIARLIVEASDTASAEGLADEARGITGL
ncbi:MAG: phosphoglucosamine mutase [Planctomycetota bacterium]|nr:phosphoglucosamine mutase [Planctomycetota bacterium]